MIQGCYASRQQESIMAGATRVSVLHIIPIFLLFLRVCQGLQGGMLYPRDSESRTIKDLNGMWNFRADTSRNRSEGFDNFWYKAPLSESGPVIPMPVPSSYQDITEDKTLRDFVGWVWYDRGLFPPVEWKDKRIVLRIDSAHYNTIVWLNGVRIMSHVGGHLPFETAINDHLQYDRENLISVAINNTMTRLTLPPGSITFKTDTRRYPPGFFEQTLQFDFFNYAGIHRSVRLYTTPKVYVDDITIVTTKDGATGIVNYKVSVVGAGKDVPYKVSVNILDKRKQSVASGSGEEGKLNVKDAIFWWPYTMNATHFGYMYALEVRVKTDDSTDIYRQPFGIRTIRVTETQLLINEKPFYCHGFGKHEDSDFRGKGLDLPLIAKDFNMLKWLGANCFRTSHYPYAEEIMDQADQQGIVVIDECPAVGIREYNMGPENLAHHLEVMEELVRRDKNRPSALIWSVANEPRSWFASSRDYFGKVINHTRSLDSTRPVTFVTVVDVSADQVARYVDVLCVNRYYAWYSDMGRTEVIKAQLTLDLHAWHNKYKKPVMLTEYGADTIDGIHMAPSTSYSEEFQADFNAEYHKVYDDLRTKFLVGELAWNFADFMTCQQQGKVVGNKKGLLTRQRQPKYAAHKIRERYHRLINESLTEMQEPKKEPQKEEDYMTRLLALTNQVTLSDPFDVFVTKLCKSQEVSKGQEVASPDSMESGEKSERDQKLDEMKQRDETEDGAIRFNRLRGWQQHMNEEEGEINEGETKDLL